MQLRKKKNKLRCYLCLFVREQGVIFRGPYVDFKAKVKKGMVITSSY